MNIDVFIESNNIGFVYIFIKCNNYNVVNTYDNFCDPMYFT